MKSLVMNEIAEIEFIEILAFHDRTWAELGRNLYREFQSVFEGIRREPELHPPYRNGYRFAVLSKSPFVVYFEELNDRIWVACIAHERRKPGYWLKRKPPQQKY